ncbi:MAG: TonB-dependent receptor, partial [Verrucomicrobiota bacterium]
YRDGSERENNGDTPPNPSDFESHAVVATATYKKDALTLDATVDLYHSDRFTDGDSAEGSFFGGLLVNDVVSLDNERERIRFSLGGHYENAGEFAFFDKLSAQAYWQESTDETLNVQIGQTQFGPFPSPRNRTNDITYTTEIIGLDTLAEKNLESGLGNHVIRYGFEVSYSEVTSEFLRTDNNLDGTQTLTDRIGIAPSDVTRFGIFLNDEITLGADQKWVITPGLRFDHYSVDPENTEAFLDRTIPFGQTEPVAAEDYENDAFAPSLSILYNINENLNVYGIYGHGIRNPSAEELNGVFTHGFDFIVVPNPELTEETSDSFEIGVQGSYSEHSFQVAGFYNLYEDFLEANVLIEDNPAPLADVRTTVNLQEVTIYGWEARWDWIAGKSRGQFEGVEAGLSASWTKGERDDIDQPLNTIDPWKGVAYLGYQSPDDQWGARLTGTYIGEKNEDDIDQTTQAGEIDPLDSVFTLDFTAFYRFNDNWAIRGGINNITDEEYLLWSTARRGGGHGGDSTGIYTQPGTNFFLALSADF